MSLPNEKKEKGLLGLVIQGKNLQVQQENISECI